jgi:DNA-binding MarR family transcriptional regulator
LHAIRHNEGITANEIVGLLHIDKSYLSKIIIRFEKRKFLTKKVSRDDARVYHLQLTALGKREFGVYDKLSDDYVKQILAQLPEEDCAVLIASMEKITAILGRVRL